MFQKQTFLFVLLLMSLVAALAAGQGASTSSPRKTPDYERLVEESYPIEEGALIRIEHCMGDLTVTASDRNEVSLLARIEVEGDEAREFGERIEILVNPGSTFFVETEIPSREEKDLSFGIELELKIPKGHGLEVENAFGDVLVSGIEGKLEAEANNGDVTARNVKGEILLAASFGNVLLADSQGTATIEASNGEVDVERLKGGDLFVEASFGPVRLSDVDGAVEIASSNGEIRAQRITGSVKAEGSFGGHFYEEIGGPLHVEGRNASIKGVKLGATAHVETAFGGISLQEVAGQANVGTRNGKVQLKRIQGAAAVECSFGQVEIEEIGGGCKIENRNGAVSVSQVRGDLEVESAFGPVKAFDVAGGIRIGLSNGNIEVGGLDFAASMERTERVGDIHCSTQFGTILLHLPQSPSARIEALTTFGKVSCPFKPTEREKGIALEECLYTLGGGDLKILLETSNGDIRIVSDEGSKI